MIPENAERLLKDSPHEKAFKLHMGIDIRNLRELAEALDIMADDAFKHHVNESKNDFASWIRHVVGDEELAKSVEKSKARKSILEKVRDRVNYLEGRRNRDVICPKEFLTCGAVDFAIGAIVGFVIGVIFSAII